jgi:hypothetical protein
MGMLAPDILEETRALSLGANLTAIVLGAALWFFGWRGYRFWIVLAATVTAGIAGLMLGPVYGTQPAVTGLLLAVVAGLLALSLARMVVFLTGGFLTWLTLQSMIPALSDPWPVPFLTGGLVSLLLFRLWTMALTSFAGSLLILYGGLSLADRLLQVNVVELAQQRPHTLNSVLASGALVGFLLQFILDRRRTKKANKPAKKPPQRRVEPEPQPPAFLGWVQGLYKQAG